MASHCTEVLTRSICDAPAALRASRSGQDLAPALPRRLSTVIIIITTCFPNYDPRAPVAGGRQRLAVQIWRDYQDHIDARIKYADPDEDDKRRHEEEAQVSAEEQELAARRLFNEAYLQRVGRPQAFGLC